MRRRGKVNQKKEKFVMLLSSVFVLSALTITGVYVKERNKIEQENSVDFSKLENSAFDKAEEIAAEDTEKVEQANTAKALNQTTKVTSYEERYQYSGVPIVQNHADTEQNENLAEEAACSTILKLAIVSRWIWVTAMS